MTDGAIFEDKKAVARTLLTAFIFPWIFDVRALPGAEWLLYYQLASFLFTTVVFVLSVRIFKNRVDLGPFAGNALNIAVCVIFVGVSMFSGFVEHNEPFKVFAFAIPTVLFIYSLVLVSLIAESGLNPEDVLDVVVVMAAAAIFVRVPIVAILFGINFDTVRYQILSGAGTVGIAFVLARLMYGLKPADVLFGLVQTAIILLSVTRGAILVSAGMAGILFACKGILRPKTLLIIGLGVPLFILAIFALGSALPGNPIARWTVRTASLQGGDVDISGLERESQILFQLDKLSTGGVERFIGFGIAAPGGNSPLLQAYAASRGVFEMYTPTGFADHTYISLIFLGGVLGGGPLLLAQILWFSNAIRAIRFVLRTYSDKLSWVAMAPLAVIGYQIANILGASFADRCTSIFFGLCLGVTGWLMALHRRSVQARKGSGLMQGALPQMSE
jgi:hypothetical protein